jgi:DivIVA domain-containing protein
MGAMDVTPQMIEEVDFAEKFRGYDPDQVDEFLVRTGATIVSLAATVDDLRARVGAAEQELEAARQAGPAARQQMTDEQEAEESTRTLMLAKRTADAAIADARQEAQRLLEDAKSRSEGMVADAQGESDRMIGSARVKSDEMLREATENAEREYGSRRDTILKEIGEHELRKQAAAADLDALEQRVDEYRGGLEAVSSSLRTLLDDPVALHRRPPLDIRIEAPTPTPTPVHAEAPPAPAPGSRSGASLRHGVARCLGPACRVAGRRDPRRVADRHRRRRARHRAVEDRIEPAARAEIVVGGAGSLIPEDVETFPAPAVAASDPWGPGSWSAVVDAGPEPEATAAPGPAAAAALPVIDDVEDTFADLGPGIEFIDGDEAFAPADTPGHDRYLRDLDLAVNRTEGDGEDAMTAFFEGEDDQQTRRFGRRR